jgi:hypothetical protein
MKNLKLQIIALTMCMASVTSFGQSRESAEKIKFSASSNKLTKATGWEQNKTTKEWIENKNVIDNQICKPFWVSRIPQNFTWIKISTIERNEIKYYVLLFEKKSGKYKYPNIQQDWESETQTHFFLLDTNQYAEIKEKLKLNNGETITITSSINGYITDRFKILGGEHLYNEDNLLNKIKISIDNPSYDLCFNLNSQIIDNKNIVRFRLPESCYSTSENIKTKYFEIGLNEFKILFLE